MKYLTTTEIGKQWNLSARRVGILCAEGRIPGAVKMATLWLIPKDAKKPFDRRRKTEYKDLDKQ